MQKYHLINTVTLRAESTHETLVGARLAEEAREQTIPPEWPTHALCINYGTAEEVRSSLALARQNKWESALVYRVMDSR